MISFSRARASLPISVVACVVLITGAGAQDSLEQKLAAIEKAIDARRVELNIPGAALAVVRNDKVILIKGMGERDVANKHPVTPDTLFAIGSTSKAFTALTVLMGVDAGKIALEDHPRKHLPYFKLRDPEADAKITISDLLSHRSGLSRTDLAWYTGRLKPKEIIRVAGGAKATAKLGEKFQYQNVMYLAAGEIAAAVNNSSWTELVERRIFKPLRMSSSNISVPRMRRARDFARGYTYDSARKLHLQLPMRDLAAIAPAGGINSNARDMAQWIRLMLGGGQFEGKRLVSEKSFAELTKKRIGMGGTAGYGLGWMLRDWKGHAVVEHGGNIDGFNAQVALMPEQNLGFVLLTNVSASPLGGFAMKTVWEQLVGPKDSAPTARPAGAGVPPEKEAGTYTLAAANVKMVVSFQEGRLVFSVPGQPPYPLQNVGGRRYKLAAPAPDGFFVTFRASAANPPRSEIFLEQPHGNVVVPKEESSGYKSALTVEEIMQKAVQALGGEGSLRKHRSLKLAFTALYDEQGLTGKGAILHAAPNRLVETENLYALGKRIATARDYCDGQKAGLELSFTLPSSREGGSLTDSLVASDFYGPLNWRSLFKSAAVVGEGKVGEEEVYIVEKTPEKGSPVRDHISKKSFLLLKREGPGTSESFDDYREVDGVKLPFRRVRSNPLLGEGVLIITEARFDVAVSESAFTSRAARARSGAAPGDPRSELF